MTTLNKSTNPTLWRDLEKAAYTVARDLEGDKYASEKVSALFLTDEVDLSKLVNLFDRNGDGQILMSEFDAPKMIHAPGCSTYDYDYPGDTEELARFSCITSPQNHFLRFATLFEQVGGKLLDSISDIGKFRYSNPTGSAGQRVEHDINRNDNLPLLLATYEPVLTYLGLTLESVKSGE